jgi:hypothetical protein
VQYYLLGVILEKVTNKDFAKLLEEKIFQPLGMKNTGYYSQEVIQQNFGQVIYKKKVVSLMRLTGTYRSDFPLQEFIRQLGFIQVEQSIEDDTTDEYNLYTVQ